MQTKKAKYHLKRIETILDLHEGNLSAMDRDILLEDIRHLYDLVLFANDSHPEHKIYPAQDKTFVAPEPPPLVKPATVPTPSAHRDDPVPPAGAQDAGPAEMKQDITPPAEIPTPREEAPHTPTTVTYEQPSTKSEPHVSERSYDQNPAVPTSNGTADHNNSGQLREEAPHTPTTVTYEQPSAKSEPPVSERSYDQNPAVPTSNGTADHNNSGQLREEEEEIMVQEEISYPELFDFAFSSDLSDRLANTKIDNLNRVLTINDKILYINHLFGGEAIPFQDTLRKFEGFYTYDEAKQFASRELVLNYNWTTPDKY